MRQDVDYYYETKSESMKKILLLFLAFVFVSSVSFGQGEKSLKMASKSLSEYKKDPFGNVAALDEMKAHLDEAFKDEIS